MKIFLLGLPGCGKSTLGKQLANHMSLTFIDLDDEIEKKEGQPINQIFRDKGEPYFRQSESSLLSSFLTRHKSFVMATGGGTPCFDINMDLMNKAGTTVFLDASVEICAERIASLEKSDRPMFQGLTRDQVYDRIGDLRRKRLEHYQRAKIILEGNSISLEGMLKVVSF